MIGRPEPNEAAAGYFVYIDKVDSDEILAYLDAQTRQLLTFFQSFSEERSLHRYEVGKWSVRETLHHINDTERVFGFRAFFFARGNQGPLPGFDQDDFNAHTNAEARSWASHVEEFEAVRASTMAMFRNLPAEAWLRTGTIGSTPATPRAMAFAVGGHAEHHRQILVARYV